MITFASKFVGVCNHRIFVIKWFKWLGDTQIYSTTLNLFYWVLLQTNPFLTIDDPAELHFFLRKIIWILKPQNITTEQYDVTVNLTIHFRHVRHLYDIMS